VSKDIRYNCFKTAIISGLLIIQIFCGCSERERTNIFDPSAGIDSLDLTLIITSADTVTTLKWFPPTSVDYTGFNLYRRAENESQFALVTSLSSNQKEYKDRALTFDVSYEYYLTIQGENSESPPSPKVKVTPGPLSFWILDRWGLNIFKTTYDLRHKRITKFAVWIPENLAFDTKNNLALVTYPQYRFAEIFDQYSGATTVTLPDFIYPFDCVYDPHREKFWLTDSSGYLYKINPIDGLSDLIDQSLQQPSQIIISNQTLYVIEIGRKQVIIYNSNGNRVGTLKNIGNIELQQPIYIQNDPLSEHIYIIDQTSTERILYRYAPLQNSLKVILKNEHLKTIKVNPRDNSIWLSIDNELNSSLMQLSNDEVRLELKGFSGISDFRINPSTGTLIVADYVEGFVKHIRTDSSTIGTFKEAIYPSKVYTE